jgi:hypothetical protein
MAAGIDFLSSLQQNSTVLDIEHGLVMLLLLYGLLTYRGSRLQKWVPVVVITGILLAILTPTHRIPLFWPIITGLITPPFLWQAAINITQSSKPQYAWSVLAWMILVGLTAASLTILSGQALSTSILLGTLTITLVWYFRESAVERSFLSTLGQISLVVLLTEIDLAIISWRSLFGSFFSGAAIGFVLGFVGLALYRQIKNPGLKKLYFFFWAYVTYLGGAALETSPIAATLAAAILVAVYGYNTGLWASRKEIPVPVRIPLFFYLSATAWLVLGWQASTNLPLEKLVSLPVITVIVMGGVLVLRKLLPLNPADSELQFIKKSGAILMLLGGALLLWPAEGALSTLLVELAILISIALILLLREIIHPLFDLLEVPFYWPADNINQDE